MSVKKTSVINDDLQATPEDEDFGHKYTDEGSGKIGSKLINSYFNNVAELVSASDVPAKKRAKAIEIGCGEGYSTQRLRNMLPENIILSASEYVAHQIPAAKKINPGIEIIKESAYETTHKDNTFDLVFLLEVLEHLDHPSVALQELARITKPGGYMVLGVPREPLWCMLNMARGKYLPRLGNTPGHLNHWTTKGITYRVGKDFGPIVQVNTPLPWTLVLAQKRPS